jgi:16S rRNA (uracil1498-N3)-methyltransferase
MPEIIDELRGFDLVLIPYENEEGTTIKQVLGAHDGGPDIAVLIGPEGGFTEDEVRRVVDAGGRSVTLGKTTLRTETAGPAALAMIMYELEL